MSFAPGGWTIVRLATVGSTNDEAKARAAAGAPHGTVVTAAEQTAGRGRDGRSWTSPPGNLYASAIVRPGVAMRRAAELSFAAALAVGDALDLLVPMGVRIGLKWPNDVLIDRRKIAGILLEADGTGEQVDWLVIGLGVNCAHHPEGTATPATDLRTVIGTTPAPAAVLDGFLGAFAAWYERWQGAGLAALRTAWLDRAEGLGEAMQVRTARETLHGRFRGIDEAGALVLATDAGERRIAAGDVFFAR